MFFILSGNFLVKSSVEVTSAFDFGPSLCDIELCTVTKGGVVGLVECWKLHFSGFFCCFCCSHNRGLNLVILFYNYFIR